MAEIFANQIITEAGLALAAQATASNPIEYIGALSHAYVPSDPTDKDDYTGRAGQIDAASATDNVARIIASYFNCLDDSPQDVKAIAILGKLSSQSDAEAVVVAYAADSNSNIVLPRSSAPAQVTRFAFNLAFNAGTVASTFQTGDATIEDLDRLVSCHRAGQPTTGDYQEIYGNKKFHNHIYTSSIVQADEFYIHLLGGKTNPMQLSVGWDSNVGGDLVSVTSSLGSWNFTFTNDLIPMGSGGKNLGNSTYHINNAYIDSIQVGGAHTINLDGNTDNIQIDSSFLPLSSDDYDLGNHSKYWGEGYIRNVRTANIKSTLGSSNVTLSANLVPNSASAWSLGNSDYTFDEIHADKLCGNLEGCFPYQLGEQLNPVVPVGGLIVLKIRTSVDHATGTDTSTRAYKYGAAISGNQSSWRFYYGDTASAYDTITIAACDFGGSATDGSAHYYDLRPADYPEHTLFVLLSPLFYSSTQGGNTHPFLVMRIS